MIVVPFAFAFDDSFADTFATLDKDRIEFTTDYNYDFMADVMISYVESSCDTELEYSSVNTIFEKIIKCTVEEHELKYTYNKTTLEDPTDENSNIKAIFISDDFTPYVTSVGLYNDANELLAVAKFDYPIHMPKNTSITFVIRIDF